MERFWNKAKKTKRCWEWSAAKTKYGYGWFSYKGSPKLAHRVAWILTYGEIPANKFICHRCDNTLCIRPDHLFVGDHKDNMADMVKKGRHADLRGIRGPKVILNEKQVKEIRKRYVPIMSLAKEYGVSKGCITAIIYRKSWTHI